MTASGDVRPAIGPRIDPAVYPGARPARDFLLEGDRIGPLPAEPAPLLAGRHAVIAFGSNAAPAQLMAKFGPSAGPIAVTRARLHGFAVGHSPHVSSPGYVPWVLVDTPGFRVECAVLWLDDAQRAVLDATEPNYDLVRVDARRYPLVGRATGAAVGYAAYRGRWGALRWPGEGRPARATGQAEVFRRLGALDWFRRLTGGGDLVGLQRLLAADAGLRGRVREELAARRMTGPDGWAG
jgi:hypothetical protein